jgi:L-seryl-tRNA(Ser) seleniumtransferase
LSGGGSLPGVELSGVGIEVVPHRFSVDSVVKKLRSLPTPIICLVRDNALVIDVRCIFENDMGYLCNELIKLAGYEFK